MDERKEEEEGREGERKKMRKGEGERVLWFTGLIIICI